MSYVDWIHTKRQPEGQSSRLYHVEPGCALGLQEDDGHFWYRISCSYWFGDWIEEQDKEMWRIHGGRHRAIYIVREDLMTLIRLKWL